MICLKYQNWHISGKCLSILMFSSPRGCVLSQKSQTCSPPVLFNNVPVKRCSIQKHLGIHLDEKLNFNHHVTEKITKANRGIAVIKKLSNTLPKDALLMAYDLQIIYNTTCRLQ